MREGGRENYIGNEVYKGYERDDKGNEWKEGREAGTARKVH